MILDIQWIEQFSQTSVVVKMVAAYLGALLLIRVLRIWFNEQTSNRSKLHAKFTYIGPILIWIGMLIVWLSILGVDINTIGNILLAGGLIIGLVITPAASNAVAGFLNAWSDVFRVDEVIEVDHALGRVVNRRIMSTRIETIDGTLYDIPNKLLLDRVVHNFTRIPHYRIRADIHIDDPNFSLRQTEEILQSVVHDNPLWNRVDQESQLVRRAEVRYHQMAGSSHLFHVYAWIESRMMAPQRQDELLRACALALEDAGISFGQTTNLGFPFGIPNQPAAMDLMRWAEEDAAHRNIPVQWRSK
ncbi:MAG: mechanosensitive ion channel domain-containing protein [Chloroflexota bacterium]